MGCCGPSLDDACGWPKNTIRAILSVLIVIFGFSIAAAVIGFLLPNNKTTEAIAVLGSVFTVMGVVTTFYFSSQSAAATTKIISDTANQLVEAKNSELSHLRGMHERMLRKRTIKKNININRNRNQESLLPSHNNQNNHDNHNPVIIVE